MPKDAENKAKDGQGDGDSSSSDPSKAGGSKPSSTKGKVYSEAEVQALLSQRHSALDSQIASLTKENRRLKPFEKAAQDAEKETADAKAEVRAVKAEMAKEKPDVMQFFQAEEDIEAERAKIKKERRELEQRVSEVEDDIEAARTSKHEKVVREAAKEAGVDADLMLTIFPKPVEGVDLKAIASKLPKVKAKEEEEGSEGEESSITANPWAGWNPDSGLSSGGEGEATEERLTKTANKGDMKAYAKLRGHEKLVTKE